MQLKKSCALGMRGSCCATKAGTLCHGSVSRIRPGRYKLTATLLCTMLLSSAKFDVQYQSQTPGTM
eukprot:3888733-Rhodomonas_salina.1